MDNKYHMNGGDDLKSYAKNSEYQKQLLGYSKKVMNELIQQQLDVGLNPHFDHCNPFRIADFGCSTGRNTYLAAQNIIEAVEQKYKSNEEDPQVPEFLVFFNDLVQNDFNTLFNYIHSNKPNYFGAGVPGSFHGRVFPKAFLHIAHSSMALLYLSRIPEEVKDRNSAAWNKGRIHYSCSGAAKEVEAAYSTQFRKDIEAFLDARAEELIPGGLMVIITLGILDGVLPSECSMGVNFSILGSCLEDMAKMGIISEEKLDSFNLPYYYTSHMELETLIKAHGCFDIARFEKLPTPFRQVVHDIQTVVLSIRAVTEGLFEEHFGKDVIEELFQRYAEKVGSHPVLYDDKYRTEASYFVFLKRKTDTSKPGT
ncbi:loganic acid O-methyltransferase-like isoform X1 [Nicotiana tabacum]|uniref:Loganic acid O-methyltransferase-like isoform X1 n=3 Tax=Nicotiana TaxID=4085 RepID=A0A1S3Y634_TOBAC|nr:PREDICTED: probable S-adenosylmethionine-dependent methyltransferase At5g38780 [Nicotiana sylvestris]XP_016447357.1 PREDICTED: probable S-adenosylmethionine-dependent methyltransferase At5g38780 isoform X1 [Nicotiana tabacum]